MNSAVMIAATAAARRRAAAERQIMDAFRLGDATRVERARSLAQLGVEPTEVLDRLREVGLVREDGDRRLYLDEASVIARREQQVRRPIRVWMIGVALALNLLLGLLVLLLARGAD